jgi:hypothetical protein
LSGSCFFARSKIKSRSNSCAVRLAPTYEAVLHQTKGEQRHIAAALIFELSKVKTPAIRERVVSHLLNVDDTLADAFAHRKFIGHVKAAVPLFEKAGIAETDFDEGIVALASSKDVSGFVDKLGQLRVWSREPRVKMK